MVVDRNNFIPTNNYRKTKSYCLLNDAIVILNIYIIFCYIKLKYTYIDVFKYLFKISVIAFNCY